MKEETVNNNNMHATCEIQIMSLKNARPPPGMLLEMGF